MSRDKRIDDITDDELMEALRSHGEEVEQTEVRKRERIKNATVQPLEGRFVDINNELRADTNELVYNKSNEVELVNKRHKGTLVGWNIDGIALVDKYNFIDPMRKMPDLNNILTIEESEVLRFLVKDLKINPGTDYYIRPYALYHMWKLRKKAKNKISNQVTRNYFKEVLYRWYPIFLNVHARMLNNGKFDGPLVRSTLRHGLVGIRVDSDAPFQAKEIASLYKESLPKLSPEHEAARKERFIAYHARRKAAIIYYKARAVRALKDKKLRKICDYVKEKGYYQAVSQESTPSIQRPEESKE